MAPWDFNNGSLGGGASTTILLDVGDQAVRWCYGNRFATSVAGACLVEGVYIPLAAFRLSFLPLFHVRDRLIIVAALDRPAAGQIRVCRGRRIGPWLARLAKPAGSQQDLGELLATLDRLGRLPRQRALVVIQAPAGDYPSDQSASWLAADPLRIAVERLALSWRSGRRGRQRCDEDGQRAPAGCGPVVGDRSRTPGSRLAVESAQDLTKITET